MSKLDKEALESLDSMRELMDNADCLISQEQVERALDRMAEEITRDLGDKLPVFYCVMNGGLITTGHLLTRLGFPLEVDYLHATRYRNELRGGELFRRVTSSSSMIFSMKARHWPLFSNTAKRHRPPVSRPRY